LGLTLEAEREHQQPHQPITLSKIFSYALARTTESQQMILQICYHQTHTQSYNEQNYSRPDQGPELFGNY